MAGRGELEDEVLAKITPTPQQEQKMRARAEALIEAVDVALASHGLPGRASVQGSTAKGTWLAGATDLDCFILMPPTFDERRLKEVAETIGGDVLSAPRKKYAQHPYLVGDFQGLQVDLVPAYAVAAAGARMSAVDRTPFHTGWVRAQLDGRARQDARLLKQWCKGVGIYGAETAIGGLSGYLLEVLIHHFHDFHGVLRWAASGFDPARIASGATDEVDDDVSPLVVVDPVDPSRNCAAAVQRPIMDRAQEAAVAYLDAPERRFFFPSPATTGSAHDLDAAMEQADETWVGVTMQPQTDRLDMVFPQFQKALRSIAAAAVQAGFDLHRSDVHALDDGRVLMQWCFDQAPLPEHRIHRGPPEGRAPNAARFRDKWQDHPDRAGPIQAGDDGRLQVQVRINERRPVQWLRAQLPGLPLGKHVQAALKANHRILCAPVDLDAASGPTATDFILDRRPWQRP